MKINRLVMKYSNQIAFALIFLTSLFLYSCDFTPRLHKDILLAQKLIQQQKYVESIEQYKNILERSPKDEIKLKIYYQIAELYSINLMEYEDAIFYYNKVKRVTSDPLWLTKVEEKVADIFFNFLRDYKSSAENYQKLVDFEPKLENIEFYEFRLGQSLININQYTKAITIFDRIQENVRHKYFVTSFFHEGLAYFHQKKWDKAIENFKLFIRRETRSSNIAQAKFLMANAYETMEELKIAYNIYYSILGKYPNTKVLKNRLKSIYDRRVARKR